MSRLEWDALDEREIRYGVDRGVIYPRDSVPVAWNGLVSVVETPSDADHTIAFFDGVPYIQSRSPESFTAMVDAYTYPEELEGQPEFDFSYRATSNKGTVIHLVYNAKLGPSESEYGTINSDVDISTFSWSLTTVPEQIERMGATAHIIIDGTEAYFEVMQILEDLLYGTDEAPPRMPHLPELIDIFDAHSVLVIIDNGDGTWTATGPEEMIEMLDLTTLQIISPSAFYLNPTTYTISNW